MDFLMKGALTLFLSSSALAANSDLPAKIFGSEIDVSVSCLTDRHSFQFEHSRSRPYQRGHHGAYLERHGGRLERGKELWVQSYVNFQKGTHTLSVVGSVQTLSHQSSPCIAGRLCKETPLAEGKSTFRVDHVETVGHVSIPLSCVVSVDNKKVQEPVLEQRELSKDFQEPIVLTGAAAQMIRSFGESATVSCLNEVCSFNGRAVSARIDRTGIWQDFFEMIGLPKQKDLNPEFSYIGFPNERTFGISCVSDSKGEPTECTLRNIQKGRPIVTGDLAKEIWDKLPDTVKINTLDGKRQYVDTLVACNRETTFEGYMHIGWLTVCEYAQESFYSLKDVTKFTVSKTDLGNFILGAEPPLGEWEYKMFSARVRLTCLKEGEEIRCQNRYKY